MVWCEAVVGVVTNDRSVGSIALLICPSSPVLQLSRCSGTIPPGGTPAWLQLTPTRVKVTPTSAEREFVMQEV